MTISGTEKRWRELYTAFAAALLPQAVELASAPSVAPDQGRRSLRLALAYAREAADLALDIEWEAWKQPAARDPAHRDLTPRKEPGE